MPVQSIDVILRALNGRRFNQELRAAGRSAQMLGQEFEQAATSSSALGAAGHAASGGLYAISAASRVAAYGVGALTLGVVGLGVQFNSTMEQNNLAFKRFVSGGAEGSKEFVKQLIFMAKETPLQLEGITTAARRLFAVQIPEGDILKTLKGMADMTAVTGASTDTLLRMSKALGDVHVKGRLMAEEVRQFSNLGVNWRQILDEGGLKLTQKNLENIGRAGITSTEFFKAWYIGTEKVFGGASQEYMATFAGQWEKLKDNVKIASGYMTKNLFEGPLKKGIKALNDFINPFVNDFLNDKNSSAAEQLRAKFENIAKTIAGGLVAAVGFAVGMFKLFMDTVRPAQPFFQNVLWPLLKGMFKGLVASFVVAISILKVFFQVLGFIGKLMSPFKGVFELVGQVIAFVFGGEILTAIGWLGKFGFILGAVGAVAKIFAVPIRIIQAVFKAIMPILGGVITMFSRFGGVVGAIPRFLMKIPGFFDSMGMKLKNFVGNIVTYIGARLPRQMADKFYDAAVAAKNAFIKGIKGLGNALIRAILSAGAFVVGIGTSIKNWLNQKTIFGDKINLGPLGSINVPALAEGGRVQAGGWALVGERGPELVNLPRTATVFPNDAAKTRPLTQRDYVSNNFVTLPAMATGGYVRSGGLALVGENGPEPVMLPVQRSSSIVPAKPTETRAIRTKRMGDPATITAASAGAEFNQLTETRITKVYIGRRQVAEAMGEEITQRQARSRGR